MRLSVFGIAILVVAVVLVAVVVRKRGRKQKAPPVLPTQPPAR